jgi:hypothetical protein
MRLEHLGTEHVGHRIRIRAAGGTATGVLTDIRRAVNLYDQQGHGGDTAATDRTWVTLWIDGTRLDPLEGWSVDVDILD